MPFCFGGNAQGLRISAVLAVRNGLDRKTALAALTRTPAMREAIELPPTA